MKEVKQLEDIYLEDFDIYVHKYLTYAQIQSIINAIEQAETWSDKQTITDLLILTYATSMTKEEVGSISHDVLLSSGLIDQVVGCIENIYQITDAIAFNTSFSNLAAQFIKHIPELKNEIKKVTDTYANSKK